jgi:hypothetical protein
MIVLMLKGEKREIKNLISIKINTMPYLIYFPAKHRAKPASNTLLKCSGIIGIPGLQVWAIFYDTVHHSGKEGRL